MNFICRDYIEVGDGHNLHLAQYGNPDGIPLLYLHGGPGAGCTPQELTLFNNENHRILMLDQRGAGLSKPHGSLHNNNVTELINDIEKVRAWLKLDKVYIVGGSFGATLALLYACLYPKRVSAMVLWGVFIPSNNSIDWLYGPSGAAIKFPQAYHDFIQPLTDLGNTSSLLNQYHNGFTNLDADVREAHVIAWLDWELALALPENKVKTENVTIGKNLAAIELHYARFNYFNAYQLLSSKLDKVKTNITIFQGAKDWVCPVTFTDTFLQRYGGENITLSIIDSCYHQLTDNNMLSKITHAIHRMGIRG